MIELMDVPRDCVRIWEVWVNSDSIEGRGNNVLEARFLNRADAVHFARGKGPMGKGDARIDQAIVYKSFELFISDRDKQLREAVLRRLSPDEKRVLGLNG